MKKNIVIIPRHGRVNAQIPQSREWIIVHGILIFFVWLVASKRHINAMKCHPWFAVLLYAIPENAR